MIEVSFLVNDRSLHGQFHSVADFAASLGEVMRIRAVIQRAGHEAWCHRKLLDAEVGPSLGMRKALAEMTPAQRGAWLGWLTRHGPWWDEGQLHGADDYLEWRGEVVTDTAMGEAAFARLRLGDDRRLVSFAPSDCEMARVDVALVRGDDAREVVAVENFWRAVDVAAVLEAAPAAVASWGALEALARRCFERLVIAGDAFDPLGAQPFSPGAAERFRVILGVLDRLAGCFDAEGRRTAEGHELYQQFFTGKKGEGGRGALFTDSSESEKQSHRDKLTFRHPERAGETLFCPWHGKVQTPPYRVHFSWPMRAGEPVYVVYLGWHITP